MPRLNVREVAFLRCELEDDPIRRDLSYIVRTVRACAGVFIEAVSAGGCEVRGTAADASDAA